MFACISEVGLSATYDFVGGLEKFSYLLSDDVQVALSLLESFFQMNLEKVRSLPIGFQPVAAFVPEDIAMKNTLLFSPEFLRRELFPRLKVIVDAYHSKGIKVIFHSDGNLWSVMDDLMDCGIDALNPIESAAGMDVGDLRKRYPSLVLLGGIDSSYLLPFSSAEEIRTVARKTILNAGRGYFPGSTSEVHNSIPLENYLAFYYEVTSGVCAKE